MEDRLKHKGHYLEILMASTYLGLTSFGGPIAHLGFFHHEYVTKRKWIDEAGYADLVALCQFLPGPASSQVGIGIGTMRGGILGGVLAWLGFTMPSAIALVIFAYLLKGFDVAEAGWIHGLKIVAVAIVAHAVWTMGTKLANDKIKASIAVAAMIPLILWPSAFLQIGIIASAGIFGMFFYNKNKETSKLVTAVSVPPRLAIICLVLFFLLLFILPIASAAFEHPLLQLFDSFYRSGSLVFGGGHVVLPLLESELVPTGFVSEADFLTGYGATQAVPGPLFTFSAYLGAIAMGGAGAVVALLAIFLPSFLLVIGVLPFWDRLRQNPWVSSGLIGINAAVVGILMAALYHPLWTAAIWNGKDFVLVVVLFLLMQFWKMKPWIVVLIGALCGMWI